MIKLDWDFLPQTVARFAMAIADRPDAAHELVTMLGTLGPRLPDADAAKFALQLRRHLPPNGRLWQVTENFLRSNYPLWYVDALHDETRNAAYDHALRACVRPGSLVLEIGSGSGLFAMMAARAGAEHVYSCETDPQIAQIATRNIARNGLADRVTIIPKASSKLRVGVDIPRPCDILVHEFSSSTFVVEGTMDVLSHALAELMVPGAAVLPCSYQARACLTGDPSLDRSVRADGRISGFEIGGMDALAPAVRSMPRGWRDALPMSEPMSVAEHHVERGSPDDGGEKLTMTVTSSGNLQGIVHWIAQGFPDGTFYENTPGKYCTWMPSFWPVLRTRRMEPGDQVELQVTRHAGNIALSVI